MENSTSTEIVSFEKATALTGKKAIDFFTDKEKVMMLVDEVNKEVKSFVPNVKTQKGRDEIGSIALKVSKSRKALEQAIDSSVADLQAKVKSARSVKKAIVDALNETRAEILKPRDDWQAEQDRIEQERIDGIKERIENLRMIGATASTESNKEVIAGQIEALENVDVSVGFDEFTQDAAKAVQESILSLNARIQAIVLSEREEAQRKQLEEEQKKNKINERLHTLAQIPMSLFGKSSAEIQAKIDSLENFEVSESEFEERTAEAVASKDQVVANLKIMLSQAVQLEALNKPEEPVSAPSVEPESKPNQETPEPESEEVKRGYLSHPSGKSEKPFKREKRYFVVKRSDLTAQQTEQLQQLLDSFALPVRESVVVESDWPEYEDVWAMIESRVTGK